MPPHSSRPDGGAVSQVGLFLGISVLAGVLVAGLALPFAGGLGFATRAGADHFESLPAELETPPLPERSRILAADGSTLATFYSENRVVVPLDEIAPVMKDAMVAIEDSRFYQHGGLDLKGTLRALMENTQAGDVQQGGSTLTQQYVKNVLVENATTKEEIAAAREQSIQRKVQELRYAIDLEEQLTKDQILGRYLNIAYFGDGAYGVEAAARHYFDKSAAKLRLHEAAMLAGIVRSPGAYDPTRDKEAARERRDLVLDRMAQTGTVTGDEAAKAKEKKLGLRLSGIGNGCSRSSAPFFCDYVYSLIENEPAFGATQEARRELLYRGGLTIHTTLSPKAQKAAQRSVAQHMNRTDKVGGAIAMVEPGTGRVRAMAQNRGYGNGKGSTFLNYAVDRQHGGSNGFQAGSTFKPFVMAAALKQGIPLSLRLPANDDMTIDGFENCRTGAPFEPYADVNNYGDSSYGMIDMRTATWRSVNTYYVQLEKRTGLCAPPRLAEKMGLRQADGQPLSRLPSWVLGTDLVTPLSMAEAYATFAARGKHCDSVAVTKVVDRQGDQLEVPKPKCTQVMPKKVADAVNSVLADNIDGPDPARTGARMSIGRPAGGKTGTTQNTYAVWFAGYTPDLASAVWVGHPQRSVDLDNRRIGGTYYGSLCGGCLPGPMWAQAMSGALRGTEATGFAAVDPKLLHGKQVTVPDVRDMSASEAEERLRQAGLEPQVSSLRKYSSVAAGRAVDTSPGAGSSVAPGSTVQIYLSNGLTSSRGGDDRPDEPQGPPEREKPKPDKPREGNGNGNGGAPTALPDDGRSPEPPATATPTASPSPGGGGSPGSPSPSDRPTA
jgi:membrane peptidoglycan carboxypeptidase